MKKKNLLITLSVIIILLILFTIVYVCFIKEPDNPAGTDSSKVNTVNHLKYNHSSNYVYTGFADIPEGYSAEDAINDGCFVIEAPETSSSHILSDKSDPKVSGAEHWQRFLDNSSADKNTFLRVAHFIGSDYCAFKDLYYADGLYYLYMMDEYGIHQTGPYKYLRKLEGTDGIPPKNCYYYVITDSLKLTFMDVRHAMYASDLRTVTKIPYTWLGFTVYLD